MSVLSLRRARMNRIVVVHGRAPIAGMLQIVFIVDDSTTTNPIATLYERLRNQNITFFKLSIIRDDI
jgi:hypothetical protein